jgi:glutamate--cysteine ligase
MAGTLAGFEGQMPTMADFEDHMTTAFPEVRLKQFLEMRGADSGMWANICALPAFWVGLLYDDEALEEAASLASDLRADDVMAARLSVAKDGFRGRLGSHDVYDLATRLVSISSKGLRRRGILDSGGGDESGFLSPLRDCLDNQRTPAEMLLDALHGEWKNDVSQIFNANSF